MSSGSSELGFYRGSAYEYSQRVEAERAAQRAKELEAARVAAEERAQAELKAQVEELAIKTAKEAIEAAAKVLAEEAAKKEAQREKEFQDRVNAAAEARIKEIQEKAARESMEKDKIIELYMKAVDEYKNALNKTGNAVDLEKLVMEYMQVAKQNQYLLDLIKNMTNVNPLDPILLRASIEGDIKSAQAALRLGANVNTQDMLLDTPLHKACLSSDKQMVEFLLSNGSDTTIKNVDGKRASDLTIDTDILKLISAYQRPKSTHVSSMFATASAFFGKSASDSIQKNQHEIYQSIAPRPLN